MISSKNISVVVAMLVLIGTMAFTISSDKTAPVEKKNILILTGKSTHNSYSHNNKEVGDLILKKLVESKYAGEFNVTISHMYPKDLSLVENADLIIISSDGGRDHALADKGNPTKNTRHLDAVLKKQKQA